MTNNLWKSADIATGLMFAPLVMMMRLPIMSAEAQKLGSLPIETIKATSEKTAALAEGIAAYQLAYLKAVMSFWPEVITGRQPSIVSLKLAERAVQAAITPASRRVRANFRRLTGKKPRR
jgi:hypothetical protein